MLNLFKMRSIIIFSSINVYFEIINENSNDCGVIKTNNLIIFIFTNIRKQSFDIESDKLSESVVGIVPINIGG